MQDNPKMPIIPIGKNAGGVWPGGVGKETINYYLIIKRY